LHGDWCEYLNEALNECYAIYVAGLQIINGQPLDADDKSNLIQSLDSLHRIGRMFGGKS
jgi:hypothetical protein